MHEKQQRKRRKIQKRNAEIANHIFYIKFTKKGETLFSSVPGDLRFSIEEVLF